MRPIRRTGTATVPPSLLRGRGTVDIRLTTVRCRRYRRHGRTGVHMIERRAGRLVATSDVRRLSAAIDRDTLPAPT